MPGWARKIVDSGGWREGTGEREAGRQCGKRSLGADQVAGLLRLGITVSYSISITLFPFFHLRLFDLVLSIIAQQSPPFPSPVPHQISTPSHPLNFDALTFPHISNLVTSLTPRIFWLLSRTSKFFPTTESTAAMSSGSFCLRVVMGLFPAVSMPAVLSDGWLMDLSETYRGAGVGDEEVDGVKNFARW